MLQKRNQAMANITAAMVNDLRAKTGQGMMECKKALTETGGDIEKAVEYFRKKGVKTSITERSANEGRVFAATSADRRTAAAIEVNCNTDFTAKSEEMGRVVEKATQKLLQNPSLNLTDDAEIQSDLKNLAQKTGENVVLGRVGVITNVAAAGSYLYSTAGKGKSAVIMGFEGNPDQETVTNIG